MRATAALAGLALIVRGSMLGSRFPYIDDLLQLYAVTRPSAGEAARAVAGIGPLQPPLDYAADFLAARATGDLAALRLLPLAWGVLSVAAAVRIGERRAPGLGAWWGALLAVSMPLVSFSVTLRPYSLAVLLGLLCWLAFDHWLETEDPRPYAAAQAAFQLAYPHAWLVGLAQLAFVALERRGRTAALARALVPSWLALAAWLGWWHLQVSTAGGFHYEVAWSALALIARSFHQAQGPGLYLYPALVVLGAAAALRAGPLTGFVRLAALASVPPLLTLFAVHRAESVLLLPRHALPLLPAYLALAAAGCASARSRAARGALAVALAWAAADPLLTLARRERDLSGYLAESVGDLSRRAGPSDALVFADPNTGATVLHALDRGAFDALGGVLMRDGFALFRFPPALTVGPLRLEAFTLCFVDPSLATADAARVRALRAAGRRVWLVSLEGLNALPQERPFAALGVPDGDLLEIRPGLHLLR
ncbi:MAG: hypothetical protein HYX59_12350 [Elusimicrobia bacterium]|nr:hypothetical protein [Elusimicrobiota bacterium]